MKNQNWTVAKSEDGSIQINFTLAWNEIEKAREKALALLAKKVEVPGFRKGMAPVEKAKERVSKEQLLEKTLMQIIPNLLTEAVTTEKLKPATYPKIELLKAADNEPWEARALTCELPIFDLPDYKKLTSDAVRAKSITKEPARDEKINEVVKVLLDSTKIVIPQMLIEEVVNSRLSGLLERIEKLGLSLDGYLSSIGKTTETIRKDYIDEAKRAISLELILNEIAAKENIDVDSTQVDEALKASGHNHEHDEREKTVVRSILRRSKVLDFLLALV